MSITTTAFGVRLATAWHGRRSTLAVITWACLVATAILLGGGCSGGADVRPGPTGSGAGLATTGSSAAPTAARVSIQAGSRWVTVNVEVADTDAERARGLMERQTLPPDSGMVFVYPSRAEHLFWMENTLIPLDMIFIGADDRVAGIVARAEPLSRNVRGRGWISRAVLEVNGGWAAEHGVGVGDPVRYEGITFPARAPAD